MWQQRTERRAADALPAPGRSWEPSNETSLLSSSIRRFVWLGKCQMAVTKCEIDWRPAKPKPNGCVCVCVWRKKLAIPCGTVTEKGQQKQHKRQDKYLKFIGSISMTAFNGYYIRAMAYRFEGPHTAVSERSQTITKVKTRMTSGQRNRQRHQLQDLIEASSGQALLYTKYPLNWAGLTSLSPPLSVCQPLPLVLCRVH